MFDHENALDPSYLERILGCALIDIMGKKELVKRGTTSKYVWVEKPKLYYFQPNTGEQTFRYTHRLLASLPDKLEWQGKWYQVFEKDPKLPNQFQKDGKFWIPDPDNGRVQAVFIYDSLVTMTPESRMEDDEKSPIAKTARLFSDQIPIVRPLLGRKRCLVVATNQERTNPMAMMGCFYPTVKVLFADGSRVPIKEVVEKKLEGPVLSYDSETGKVVPRKIVNWFNNGKTNDWLQFKIIGSEAPGFMTRFKCTPNHVLYDGNLQEKQAHEFKEGDLISLVSEKTQLGYNQKQVILGSILGDGNFITNKRKDDALKVGIAYGHKEADRDYVAWKYKILFGTEFTGKPNVDKKYNVRTQLFSEDWLKILYKEIKGFEHGDKHHQHRGYQFSQSIVDQLDILGIAVWYADDAIKSCDKIGVNSYTEEDALKLCNALNVKFGNGSFNFCKYVDKASRTGFTISLQLSSEMMEKVAPYIHPIFKERMLKGKWCRHINGEKVYPGRNITWGDLIGTRVDEVSYDQTNERFLYKGIINYLQKARNGKAQVTSDRYDLEIEGNHNYIVGDALVHNSPTYEPAGDTVKYASDIRIRISTCAISNIGAGKGQIMEEKCWTGNGIDKYRVSKIKTTKNKCFSPFRECFVRLWFENNGQPGHGIDPVWDTYEYLRLTGQITYKMGKYTLTIPGALDGKKVDWLGFKQIILDPNRNRIKSMLGINPDTPDDEVDLRLLCRKQIHEDIAFQKYFDALSGALGRCSDCISRNEEKCQVMVSVNQGCPNFQQGDPSENEQGCDYEQDNGSDNQADYGEPESENND